MNLVSDKPNKCRACLVENPSQLFCWTAPLETVIYETITYLECFQKCTRLDVFADDQLPQSLCFQCATELRDAYEFIKKATHSHQTLLMKQELLISKADEEGQTEAAGFEWVAVQKTDDDETRNTDAIADTNVKTPPTHKLITTTEELIIKADINIADACDSASDDNFDCSPTSPQDNDSDASYIPEKEIKIKPKNETVKVSVRNFKPATNRKRRKQRISDADKTDITDEQEEHDQQSQADVECEFCNKPFSRKKIKRHIKRVHNVRMLLCHACPRTFKDASNLTQHSLTHDENRQRNFTCDQCGRKFFTRTAFLNHGKTHETNRQAEYQCEHCDKQFFHKGSLKLHMLIHTGETLECKICEKRYPRKIDLRIHMRTHSGDMPYKCRYCERAFTRVGVLNKHERHHEGFRYKCDICEKEYLNQSSLIKHRKEHTGMPLKCLICGKGFVTKSNMKRHIEGVHKIKNPEEMEEFILKVKTKKEYRGRVTARQHKLDISDEFSSQKFGSPVDGSIKLNFKIPTEKHQFHCAIGDSHFKSDPALSLHRKLQHKILKAHAIDRHIPLLFHSKTPEQDATATKTANDEGAYLKKTSKESIECSVCKRIFAAAKYSAHFNKVHKKSPNGHQCPKCTKYFAYPHQLKSHFEVHHGLRQKNVSCTVCPKMFYDKKLLRTHMITHQSIEINYNCDICGKGFKRNGSLRRHMIMHQGGKEQCKECAKRFPNMTELRIHMLIHKKENPFLCNICGKSFRLQGPLSYHMRKHRGEKYVCEHCGQEFSCQSSMRRHEYKHTGLPFKCPRCDAGQVTRGSLQRHLKEVHCDTLTAVELRELYSSVRNSRLQ